MIAEVDKLNFSYRSLNHQNIPAIAIYQSPSPTMLKYKLMKTGGDSDKYQLIEPGGEIYFPGDELFFPADKSISSTKSSTQEKNLPLNVKKEENIAEVISELDTTSQVPSSTAEETQDSDPTKKADFFWAPKELLPKVAKSLFMCKLVKSDSTTESDPCALLESTISLISNLVFKYITSVTNNNQHQVIVGLELDNRHLKLGTGVARNIQNAKLIAAHKSVHMLQEHCKVIVPNFHYFAEGGVPQFIQNSSPRLTNVYEIASKGSDQPGFYSMLQRFMSNKLQDLFFLSSEFSNTERNGIVNFCRSCTLNGLGWRLFGPVGPRLGPEDLVTTQNVCVYKKKSLMTLVKELIVSGGVTEKYHYYTVKAGESIRNITETIMKNEEDLKRSQNCLDDCPDYYNSSCAKKKLVPATP
ncbi:uncharacterized protein LOC124372355 isoform X1 [Homalodisca vitripennis]|uniref:uncharacterized protein LOC124372355 isoform X1 n=1 Tax=Homalodisca vitripennis TaxID=197043 RepID=UPI001EEB907F|nr:uncharacterized protein LOC124372355 isoform X1 [Homalodisca vitripennis]